MTKNRGLYLMRYNTTNIKYFKVLDEKNNFYCLEHKLDEDHRLGKIGFKFGRTSNIEKRLEYYKNNKEGIKYNLIKFFPCNNEKIREKELKDRLHSQCDEWFRWESSKLEHIPSEYIKLKDIYSEVLIFSKGKMYCKEWQERNEYSIDVKNVLNNKTIKNYILNPSFHNYWTKLK
tara:strand:+ start:38 stop:562 length:525 start_codon:yes stop_codon:yes gene_type:complete